MTPTDPPRRLWRLAWRNEATHVEGHTDTLKDYATVRNLYFRAVDVSPPCVKHWIEHHDGGNRHEPKEWRPQ